MLNNSIKVIIFLLYYYPTNKSDFYILRSNTYKCTNNFSLREKQWGDTAV